VHADCPGRFSDNADIGRAVHADCPGRLSDIAEPMSQKLLKRTATVGSMTLISRILGFVRDMVFARFFGPGLAMDAFFVAFKIPNFLRRLFAEGAFSQAFVPVLSEYKRQRSKQDVRDLVDRVSGTLLGILSVITLLGVAASPVLVAIFAPGFLADDSKFAVTAQMLRITFPYLLFISLVSFAAGVLNSYGRFSVPAFAPVLLNVTLIGAAVWVAPSMEQPVVALAWGVFIAGILQLALLVYALKRLGLMPKPRWGFRDKGVRRILRLMMPAIFGSSVVQINLLFDTLIASFLVTGSVSWLYFSDRMVEFPLGVFAIALSTVILPSLSHSHADGNRDEFKYTLDWALRWACLIGMPAAIGLFLLAGPVLSTLFEYDRFGAQDVYLSSLSLMGYAFGLPAFMMVKVLAPGFYSRQDTRTPVRIGVIAMLANMLLNIAFVVPMVLWGITGPHAGLAIATSLAAYLNAGMLYRSLYRQDVYRPQPGWGGFLLRVALGNGVMALLLYWLVAPTEDWSLLDGGTRAIQLCGWVVGGALIYWLIVVSLGIRPRKLAYKGAGNSGRE